MSRRTPWWSIPMLSISVLTACSSDLSRGTDGPPADLLGTAREFYADYGRDLVAHDRAKLATYYHPDGALIVLAGQQRRMARTQLDSLYRSTWTGPAFFAWDTLEFDSLAPDLVVVSGGFRWLRPGASDTARYIYLSVLQTVESGLAIRVEHETPMESVRQ